MSKEQLTLEQLGAIALHCGIETATIVARQEREKLEKPKKRLKKKSR